MRRSDRETDEKTALDIFDRAQWADVAMTDLDGKPYCVPVSPVRRGMCVYFHCAVSGKKLDALRKNSEVFITAVSFAKDLDQKLTEEYECTMLWGKAAEVDGEEKKEALRLICSRFAAKFTGDVEKVINSQLDRTIVFKITVEGVSGKHNRA